MPNNRAGRFDPSILDRPGTVFFDDRDLEAGLGKTYLFSDPQELIVADDPGRITGALERIDDRLGAGFFVAGYLGYEAGMVLDKAMSPRHKNSLPLAYFGVYEKCRELDSEDIELRAEDFAPELKNLRLNINEEEYLAAIKKINAYISAGEVYQINFTCKIIFENDGTASGLFARLRAAHPVCHSAFINMGNTRIISLSPELFLRRTWDRIRTRPMKGTVRRGRWSGEDEKYIRQLSESEKERAENLMIVDLMRNDLGKVCKVGGVRAPSIYKIERYSSLFQMTSEVEGLLRPDVGVKEIIRAAFPPGSVTGAPKIRAMEIINELEKETRGVYCGCIGLFQPSRDFLLNVAIRTIVQRGGACEMGIGSGIVADSAPEKEFQETMLKSKFVQACPLQFQLLETMLYQPGAGFAFLNEHLERMRRSARYFGWRFPEDEISAALEKAARQMEADTARLKEGKARARLLLSGRGGCSVEWSDAGASVKGPVKLTLAQRRIDPADIFLYHKTTRRADYDRERAEAQKAGFFDLVYLNQEGQVTEGAITNIILALDGRLFTPALECGLLPGIWRKAQLESGKVEERILFLDDLRRAERVMVGNSVRGAIEVEFVEGVWKARSHPGTGK